MRPLEGIVVLDMTRFVAGPYCTMLLADHGATVIKIEPIGGEETRAIPPKVGMSGGGVSVYFARFNRNKKSVCLDLKGDQGRRVLRDLIQRSDVLVENFRAGVFARLGFDTAVLESINPRLVYCSISGFGHTPGPYRDRPAFAPIVEAMAGVTRYNPPDGVPPLTIGISIGDLFPGAHAVGAITLALLERERTNRGTHIDLSMYDAMLSLNTEALLFGAALGVDMQPGTPALLSAPSGIYQARDGCVCISVVGERAWESFCHVIGGDVLLSDPLLKSEPARERAFKEALPPVIDTWLRERTRAQVVTELLHGGIPAGEVREAHDVLEDEQAKLRGMLLRVPTYAGIDVTAAASPIRIAGSKTPRCDPVPASGEHTVEVLRELLGYLPDEIDQLLEARNVASSPTEENP